MEKKANHISKVSVWEETVHIPTYQGSNTFEIAARCQLLFEED